MRPLHRVHGCSKERKIGTAIASGGHLGLTTCILSWAPWSTIRWQLMLLVLVDLLVPRKGNRSTFSGAQSGLPPGQQPSEIGSHAIVAINRSLSDTPATFDVTVCRQSATSSIPLQLPVTLTRSCWAALWKRK
jgi:hypothetical protein